MKTISLNIYQFNELEPEAKQKAINHFSDINVNYDWWKDVYSDAETIGLKITESDWTYRAHAKGSIIGTHEETARLIMENHGKECNTYKLADCFLSRLTALSDLAVKEERDLEEEINDRKDEFLNNLLDEYARIIQRQSEELTSDEAIIEGIEANEYEFLKSGEFFPESKYKN